MVGCIMGSLFAGSRAAAALGVSAAQGWRRVAELVREAARRADAASGALTAAAAVTRGPVPLLTTATRAMTASQDLKTRGAAVLVKAEGISFILLFT